MNCMYVWYSVCVCIFVNILFLCICVCARRCWITARMLRGFCYRNSLRVASPYELCGRKRLSTKQVHLSYIHTHMHTVHTYIHTYIRKINKYIHTYIKYIHTVHTYSTSKKYISIHSFMHSFLKFEIGHSLVRTYSTYIHTYIYIHT